MAGQESDGSDNNDAPFFVPVGDREKIMFQHLRKEFLNREKEMEQKLEQIEGKMEEMRKKNKEITTDLSVQLDRVVTAGLLSGQKEKTNHLSFFSFLQVVLPSLCSPAQRSYWFTSITKKNT